MTLQSFGIPAPETHISALQDLINTNGAALAGIAHKAVMPVAQIVSDNDRTLNGMRSRVTRSINGRISANNRRLGAISDKVDASEVSAEAARIITQPEPPPTGGVLATAFWCVKDPISGACHCVASAGRPDGTISGPFFGRDGHLQCITACECANQGGWYCVADAASGQAICIQSDTPPANYISGPYQSLADCSANCRVDIVLWWCVRNTDGSTSCIQSVGRPGNYISGPYQSKEQCEAACTIQDKMQWWCIRTSAGPQCMQSLSRPQGASAGPFDSAISCAQACEGPPPPPNKWKCLDNGNCVQAPDGQYDSLTDCMAYCSSPPPPPPPGCCPAQVIINNIPPTGIDRRIVNAPSQPVPAHIETAPQDPVFTSIVSTPDKPININVSGLSPGAGKQEDPTPIDIGKLPVAAQCGLDPQGGLPAIGSAEWCACLAEIKKWFEDIGQRILHTLLPCSGDETDAVCVIISHMCDVGGSVPWVGGTIETSCKQFKQTMKDLFNALNGVGVGSALGDLSLMLGVAAVRALITMFEDLDIGINFIVKIETHIRFRPDQLIRVLDYLMDYMFNTEIPSIADALECYKFRVVSDDLVKCWLMLRGASPDVWLDVAKARREKLQPREVIEFLRRNDASEDQQVAALRSYGFIDTDEAKALVKLYDEIPSIADFLHYLQRNVFDDQYVKDYRLLEGFDTRYWPKFGKQLRAKGITEERSKLDYAAHWINPAPTELREFLYRLRPTKDGVDNKFSIEDYERLLTEQDISPYARERFKEIAYRVPALGYLRDMYRNNVIDEDQLKSYHQDLGYTEKDSANFVTIDKTIKQRMRAQESHGWTATSLSQAYAIGAIEEGFYYDEMSNLGWTEDEATKAYDRAKADIQRSILTRARGRVMFATLTEVKQAVDAGVISDDDAVSAITKLGWTDDFARGWLSIVRAGAKTKLAKAATARIKRAFLSGEIDEQYVRSSFAQLGVTAESADTFLASWALEQTPNRRRRTASQIVADVSLGAMDTSEAVIRLTNLGYADADQRLFLADAQRRIVKLEQQALASEQKAERRQAAELERLARQAKQQHAQFLASLRRLSPLAKLQKWAKLGLIGRDLFFERLRTLEYDDLDIERYYEEACTAKGAKCAETTETLQGPPNGSLGSGFPGVPPERGPT